MLMSFSTGEDWNSFMYELANTEGYDGEACMQSQSYQEYADAGFVTKQCGVGAVSYIYFFAFTILVSILIMNLSVAAVIEGLDTAKKENMGVVEGEEINDMIDLWMDYDKTASGWISTKSLIFFLYELKPKLGKPKELLEEGGDTNDDMQKGGRKEDRYVVNYDKGIVLRKRQALTLLKGLKIKVNKEHQVHFVDVFKALVKRIFVETGVDYKLSPNLNKKIKSQWVQKGKDAKSKYSADAKFTAEQQQAGMIIVRWLESRQHRIKLRPAQKK